METGGTKIGKRRWEWVEKKENELLSVSPW